MSSIWMQGHLVRSVSSRQVKLLKSNSSLSFLAPLPLAQDVKKEVQLSVKRATNLMRHLLLNNSVFTRCQTFPNTPPNRRHLQRPSTSRTTPTRSIESGKPPTPVSAEVLPRGLQLLQAERFHHSLRTTSIYFSVLSLGQIISRFNFP